jgi:replication initiation and membrane attachment protein DnaB
MPALITSRLKDDTLQWLCENVRPGQLNEFDLDALLSATGTDEETMDTVLEHFEEIGLIDKYNPARLGNMLILKVKAHDFYLQGGFTVMDVLTEANIQKILFDLESLKKQLKPDKPDQLETYNKVTSIISSIATVYAAFTSNS